MKTITEMAREADALPYLASSGPRHLECLTRFATLVKAAHTAELLEGVEKAEPVAWIYWDANAGSRGFYKVDPLLPHSDGAFPVFATPQPAPSTSQPLTDEQAMDAYYETPPFGTFKEAFVAGIRKAEAAHKIRAKP